MQLAILGQNVSLPEFMCIQRYVECRVDLLDALLSHQRQGCQSHVGMQGIWCVRQNIVTTYQACFQGICQSPPLWSGSSRGSCSCSSRSPCLSHPRSRLSLKSHKKAYLDGGAYPKGVAGVVKLVASPVEATRLPIQAPPERLLLVGKSVKPSRQLQRG